MGSPSNALNISQPGLVYFDGAYAFDGRLPISSDNTINITVNPTTIDFTGFATGDDLHVAKWIVNPIAGNGGNVTSISAALASAISGDTIFVMPGIYTENLTLVPGVNITAFSTDAYTPNVTIVGKITMTAAGTASIAGIRLQTNGDYLLEVTGANTLTVNLIGCYINATNANAIHNTNASAGVNLYQCFGNCAANTYFIMTAGSIKAFNSVLTGLTTVNSTCSAGGIELDYTYFACPITTSGTGSVGLFKSQIICTNTTALTHGGSGNSLAMETRFESGSASAISIGATLSVVHSSVFSTNANAITGAGTLLYGMIVFYGAAASSTVNTSTQTALATLI